ncbi:hypothetical protein ACIGO9_31260 [Nocardia asteroides]|uniref:deazapurine DNA modification protein DpdA family protein n=1 Tax=Nocardia asteroides TaxID=1824 RepID=UPI0037CC073B
MKEFFLGSHRVSWLADSSVPLFISDRELRRRRKLPRATAPWSLDSGGFTELQQRGNWRFGPEPAEYVDRVRRYMDEIGNLVFAAPQDFMSETAVRVGGIFKGDTFAGTGLSVREHQRRTVENFLELHALGPDVPFIPVLQGQSVSDYLLRTTPTYDYPPTSVRSIGCSAAFGVGVARTRPGTPGHRQWARRTPPARPTPRTPRRFPTTPHGTADSAH